MAREVDHDPLLSNRAGTAMKIVIPGGSGQVGTMLARAWATAGHEVVVLSRTPAKAPWRVLPWDASSIGAWSAEIDGADVVVNLAGRNVNCRYSAANRRAIMDSRVQSTRIVGQAIAMAKRPPPIWLQSSTATIYAHRHDAANDEAKGLIGGDEADAPRAWDFSIAVARNWERAAVEAATPRTRLVLMRSAVTLSPDPGGAFAVLLGLTRWGLGGTAGDGRQYVSWIHDLDFMRAVDWLIANPAISGAVNLAAPGPLPNAEFMRTLREAWGTRIGLPAARWMLGPGALLMGTETELVLKSRRVVPQRLTEAGFEFRFPAWAAAARDLCQRWRRRPG
jgi:uncharacterized protein (TIGR01777 family)